MPAPLRQRIERYKRLQTRYVHTKSKATVAHLRRTVRICFRSDNAMPSYYDSRSMTGLQLHSKHATII